MYDFLLYWRCLLKSSLKNHWKGHFVKDDSIKIKMYLYIIKMI